MSAKLRVVTDQAGVLAGHHHWCPGCKSLHMIPSTWKFDGNMESPTFDPSVKRSVNKGKWEGDKWVPGPDVITCHYNITKGQIIFHGDSPHLLSGQTVVLPDLPETII